MIIYTDIITGDEILSDTWPKTEVDGVIWEVEGKRVTPTVGDINIGANPSSEEAEEGAEESKQTVIDVCHAFQFVAIEPDVKPTKKDYKERLKAYMKKVSEALKEKGEPAETITAFQTNANKTAAKILNNYGDYDLYLGSSMNPDGMHMLVNYREDGVTPYVVIWKHGLNEQKV
ncbi:MAG: hypothetical protein M1826_003144 [Phylliscum demangeonii]|nr:MAG: hypothetical protein M1826_003144 [Phylliscum demangeonii]